MLNQCFRKARMLQNNGIDAIKFNRFVSCHNKRWNIFDEPTSSLYQRKSSQTGFTLHQHVGSQNGIIFHNTIPGNLRAITNSDTTIDIENTYDTTISYSHIM